MKNCIIDPRCKGLIRDLEQVVNKDGTREIDKSNKNLTHFSDGFGYYIDFNLQISNSALEIQINRPEKKNAFNPEMVCELCDIWEIIESNSNIKLGILRSISTEFFSAGADLKELIDAKL